MTRIADLSLGNPLYVRELLRDAQQTGALDHIDGEWRWREELLEFDRLSVLIERRTAAVGPAAHAALEVVALVERIPLAALTALTSEDAVEQLEREGLIRVAPDAAAEVSVAHPLYGEVVAAGLPRTTAIRVRREAAEALRAAGGDVLRIAALLLESGAHDQPLFLEASARALRAGGIRFALRLAEAAGVDGPTLETGLAAAAALVDLGRFDDVEPVLAPHEETAAKAPLAISVDYLWARSRALLRGAIPDEVRTRLLDRARSWHDGPEWTAVLAAEQGWTALYDGRPHDALRHIDGFIDDERVSALRRFHMCLIAITVHTRTGRFDDAAAVAEVATALATHMAVPPSEVRSGLMAIKLVPAIETARDLFAIEKELHRAQAEAVATGDRSLQTSATMMLGQLALQRGHAADAVAYLEEAREALGEADAMNDGLAVLGTNATAVAMRGDTAGARELVDEMDRLAVAQPRHARRHAANIETVHALVDGLAGRSSAAAASLLAIADAGYDSAGPEIMALYDALRFGADAHAVAVGLRARLAVAQQPLGELFAEHAEALAADDAAEQLSVARRFRELGCDLYAAEASARAAGAFAASGRTALSREAAALATRYAEECGPVISWALQVRLDAPPLTSREREIATLAARGHTNRQISDELGLSVRTVESHLFNACQKLGVANRKSLPDVIDH